MVVDFLCGMLAAAGVQAALIRRAKEGGSYRITVTLAQVTTFEMSLGLNDKAQLLDITALGICQPMAAPPRMAHDARIVVVGGEAVPDLTISELDAVQPDIRSMSAGVPHRLGHDLWETCLGSVAIWLSWSEMAVLDVPSPGG